MLSSHLRSCLPLPLYPSIFPCSTVFITLLLCLVMWPKYFDFLILTSLRSSHCIYNYSNTVLICLLFLPFPMIYDLFSCRFIILSVPKNPGFCFDLYYRLGFVSPTFVFMHWFLDNGIVFKVLNVCPAIPNLPFISVSLLPFSVST